MKLDIKNFKAEIPKSIGNVVSVRSSIGEKKVRTWEWIVFSLIPVVGWIILLVMLLHKGNCFCVGEKGFAVFKILKKQQELVLKQEFLFENLTDLEFSKVRVYNQYNRYSQTNYSFEFYSNDKKIYSVSGSYVEDKNDGTPKSWKVYKISALLDIEDCWTNYKLPKIIDEFKKSGFAKFKALDKVIVLGLDYIKVNEVIIKKEEIRNLSVADGEFIIETNRITKGLKKNYYRLTFDVNNITNQKCFFAIYDEIVENLI